jgi:hypothetical protein
MDACGLPDATAAGEDISRESSGAAPSREQEAGNHHDNRYGFNRARKSAFGGTAIFICAAGNVPLFDRRCGLSFPWDVTLERPKVDDSSCTVDPASVSWMHE